jgi:hypothetical protein
MNGRPDSDGGTKLRRAARMALRVAPWVFLSAFIPDVIQGDLAVGTAVTALAVAVLAVPLLILIGIAVQCFPRA